MGKLLKLRARETFYGHGSNKIHRKNPAQLPLVQLRRFKDLPRPCQPRNLRNNPLKITFDMIYLLTAIGLTPGGSSTVHIYTQTIHGTTQITTNLEECGPCPVFASFTLAFALQLRKKHGKTSVRVRKTLLWRFVIHGFRCCCLTFWHRSFTFKV
jgi:hypothetical protein